MVRRVDLMVRLCCLHKNLTKLREAEDSTHILPPPLRAGLAPRYTCQIFLILGLSSPSLPETQPGQLPDPWVSNCVA